MLNKFMQQKALALLSSESLSSDRKAYLETALARSGTNVEISATGSHKTIKTTPVVTRPQKMTTTLTSEQQAVSAQYVAQAKASQAKMTPEEATVEKMPRHNQSLYHCLTLLGSSHEEALSKVQEAQSIEANQGRQVMESLI